MENPSADLNVKIQATRMRVREKRSVSTSWEKREMADKVSKYRNHGEVNIHMFRNRFQTHMFHTMSINMYSIKVSKTLDGLFDSASYDKRFRPDFGKQPTNVEVML